MSELENWIKEKTGTDFFTFTTPKDELTAASVLSRAAQNELGILVIPKDRNLQLRDILPIVIVDTTPRARRRMQQPEVK